MSFYDLLASPQARQQYWNAWYPNEPLTDSVPQLQEMMRLKAMEEQNLQQLPQRQAPMTMEQSVQQQNAAALAATPEVVDGVAQFAPMTAFGQNMPPPGQAPGFAQLLAAPTEAYPMQGQVAPRVPTMSTQMTDKASNAVEPQGGFGRELFYQANPGARPIEVAGGTPAPEKSEPQAVEQQSVQAPDRAGPLQSAQPAAQRLDPTSLAVPPPPAPEAAPEEKTSWWANALSQLRRPEVAGPLQTFFGALSAPLAPWETPGSRVARASMLMQMHRGMLAENLRTEDMRNEREQLAMREARAGVVQKEASATKGGVEAKVATALQDTLIQEGIAKLEKARNDNNLAELRAAEQEMKNRLLFLYGDEAQAAEIYDRLASAEARKRMAAVHERNAATSEKGAQEGDKVWERQKRVNRAVAQNAIRQFRAKKPNGTRAEFEQWLATASLTNPALAEAGIAIEVMRGEGEDLMADFGTGPATVRRDFKTGNPVE